MELLNSLLFVGLRRMYLLVDITEGRVCKEICAISKSTSTPFCVRIEQPDGVRGDAETPEQGEMLLANDRRGLFYDFVGNPARGVIVDPGGDRRRGRISRGPETLPRDSICVPTCWCWFPRESKSTIPGDMNAFRCPRGNSVM